MGEGTGVQLHKCFKELEVWTSNITLGFIVKGGPLCCKANIRSSFLMQVHVWTSSLCREMRISFYLCCSVLDLSWHIQPAKHTYIRNPILLNADKQLWYLKAQIIQWSHVDTRVSYKDIWLETMLPQRCSWAYALQHCSTNIYHVRCPAGAK